MALKNIRITFFYADEGVFAQVKEWRTRERLVKWADEFYKRYGFKIDEFPIPYCEKVYRSKFSLSKSKGVMADYTGAVFVDAFEISILRERLEASDEELALLKLEVNRLENNLPVDPDVTRRNKELEKRLKSIIEKMNQLIEFKKSIPAHELEFRKLIHKKLETLKISKKGPRLIVIFCWFINFLEIFKESGTIGQTFLRSQDIPTIVLWNFLSPDEKVFMGPIILIGINKTKKSFEYVLAHEIVHAAGNTTQDNQGSKGNIMIYADSEGKAPSEVNLEPSDKAKLEAAFFVAS